MTPAYRIGSLCAGIGGLELGLERAGVGSVVWQCEIDPFARQVLAKHWPDVPRYEDVAELFRVIDPGPADVVCAGFPCQDISVAGDGRGLEEGERSSLFFEVMRVVQAVGPRFVVLENVAQILTRGLDRVVGTLAALGYDAWWDCVPAAAVGAPHLRDRWFCVAWRMADADRKLFERGRRARELVLTPGPEPGARRQRQRDGHAAGRGRAAVAHAADPGLAFWQRVPGHVQRQLEAAVGAGGAWERRAWRAPEPGLGGAAHGLPAGLDLGAGRWPTATASDAEGSGSRQAGGKAKPGVSLTDAVRGDGGRGRRVREGDLWPTATAANADQGPAAPSGREGAPNLVDLTCGAGRDLRPYEPWERAPRTAPPGRIPGGPEAPPRLRRNQLRVLGNAVVPLVSEVIGRVLLDLDAELLGEGVPDG